MKALYIHFRKWTVSLSDNRTFIYQTYKVRGKFYNYGEVPDDYVEEFTCKDTVFDDLIITLGTKHTNKTLFKKREYLKKVYFDKRIYEDELLSFKIEHKYKLMLDYPEIQELEQDLGFECYSELVFDREKELKRMATKN